MGIIVRGVREFCPLVEGAICYHGFWRRKTPHYGLATMRRGLENRSPNPTLHNPWRGTTKQN